MKLKEFEYISPYWEVHNLYLDDASLIVGKNSVGKSQTVRMLSNLMAVILQSKELAENDFFDYSFTLCKEEEEIKYSFNCIGGEIRYERLTDRYGKVLIDRKGDTAFYFGETIHPPVNKLTINVRRDTKLYPQVEDIIRWAENSYGILFNQIMPRVDANTFFNVMAKCENLIPMFEKLDEKARLYLKEKMNELDYAIDKIEIVEVGGEKSKFKVLHLEERGVSTFLWEGMLSQGMLRTLFVLVLVLYVASQKKDAQTIVIDDFCEGLDYDRSIKLGRYLYDFCLENQIQLIATSNDSFLMDVVDLKYWNILQREGDVVNATNMHNSPELFEDFGFTGLSNFDLFSSDFIARHKK